MRSRRRGFGMTGYGLAIGLLSTSVVSQASVATAQSQMPLGHGAGMYAATAGPPDMPLVTFQHALAYRIYEAGERQTVVLLSNRPLDEPKVQDDAWLEAQARGDGATVLQIRLRNKDGRVVSHALFDGGGRRAFDQPDKAAWTKTTFATTRIEGQVSFYPGPLQAAAVQQGYFAKFNARIRQGAWVDPGQVRGTLRVGDAHHDLRYVRMEAAGDAVTVVLASADLPHAEAPEALAAAASAQGVAVLVTTIESKSGQVVSSTCMGKGLDGPTPATGVDWNREDWTRRLMRGRIDTESLDGAPACIVEAYFAVTP